MFQLANDVLPDGLGENPEKALATQGKNEKHQVCRAADDET